MYVWTSSDIEKLKNGGFIAQNAQNAPGDGLCLKLRKLLGYGWKFAHGKKDFVCKAAYGNITLLPRNKPRKSFFWCSGNSQSNLSSIWFPDGWKGNVARRWIPPPNFHVVRISGHRPGVSFHCLVSALSPTRPFRIFDYAWFEPDLSASNIGGLRIAFRSQ